MVLTPLFAYSLLGEPLRVQDVGGGILILLGLILLMRAKVLEGAGLVGSSAHKELEEEAEAPASAGAAGDAAAGEASYPTNAPAAHTGAAAVLALPVQGSAPTEVSVPTGEGTQRSRQGPNT